MDAASWDERYRGAELVWTAGPNRFVEEELAGLPVGRAVDLGAGEGRNALWLAERGWEVDAVDFSAVALDKAGRLAAERGVGLLRTVCADLTGWSAPEAPYDLALIAYLHLPWPQMAQVLRRAASAVRPGGTLLLVGHDAANLEHGHGGPQDPRVLYTAEQIAELWRPYADVLRAEAVTRPVTDADGSHAAVVVLVRAVRK
ncbi:class I SAM-dependent methyltransferase [Streptomyces sp. E11-3]|uniref:class I SAM-dependent methyltransferase n=1 Tax=Streptomyces sp. E11-3 TaxID=3110112 RepID=UPI00397F528C